MSDVVEPELELNQDPVAQDAVDAPSMDDAETVNDADSEEKQGLVNSFLTMGIYNAMLLLSLFFICWATLEHVGCASHLQRWLPIRRQLSLVNEPVS